MKARVSIALPCLQGLWFGWLAVVLGSLLASFASANEHELPYDERLLPLATTFLDLMLCAGFALDFEKNQKLADRYSAASWTLHDLAIEQGWDKDQFSWAMVYAHEEKSSLVVTKEDTRESFKRRHQSGKPCDDAMERAEKYVVSGIPAPP
jgi:hypothetical protein